MANKATQRELFERIKARMVDDAEVVELCDKKIEQITHKATSGNSKRAEEHNALIADIVEVMTANGKPMRATDILNALDREGMTVQKVTSMLSKMKDGGIVTKSTDKKVSTFALVG